MHAQDHATQLHHRTCPLCEGMCGVSVSVENGRPTSVRPNRDNVWSRGHICPKGTVLGDLHNDPDRIRRPMVRTGTAWQEVSWAQAYDRIETLVGDVRRRHGPSSVASFTGNMSGKGYASSRYMMMLHRLARFGKSYSSSSTDQLPKNVSCRLLYGNMWKIAVPDVDRTDLLVVIGANPAESKGSLFSHRDVMGAIRALRERGGTVVVIDPVRTRTAKAADQWIDIRPGSDAALLLAIIHLVFAAGRVRLGHLADLVEGVDRLEQAARDFTPKRVAAFCGIDRATIEALAQRIMDAPQAAIYGRIGTCTQEFGTLTSWLVDALAIVTGNFDRPGGLMWSTQVAPHLDLTPPYAPNAPILGQPSRVRGVPAILGQYPASCLAEEIDTPGEGQVKALFTLGANPVLSVPGSQRLARALPMLDCMVSLDIYLNETTRHAHVVLPSPTFLEQPHWDVWAWPWALTSGGHYSHALFDLEDGRPEEWEVMTRIGALFGGVSDPDVGALDDEFFGGMCDVVGIPRDVAMRALPDRGPERVLDLCIRTGPFGDRFGEKPDGLNLARFKAAPDGILLGLAVSQGAQAIRTPSGRIEIAHPHVIADLDRLRAAMARPAPDFVLVSRRQLRSLNSWMHNVETLVSGRDRCTLQMHPTDAAAMAIADGDDVEVESGAGMVTVAAELVEDLRPGVVCLPHGWGHRDRQSRLHVAETRPGTNINELSPAEMIDTASGNAVLNGIPVRVAKARYRSLADSMQDDRDSGSTR